LSAHNDEDLSEGISSGQDEALFGVMVGTAIEQAKPS
jgi:hypothetical protein